MKTIELENLAWRIAREMPRGYTSSEEILDSAYGACKRLFGANTARILFYYEEGFDRIMVDAYVVS